MRFPLAPAGWREMFILTVLLGGSGAAALTFAARGVAVLWPVGIVLLLAWIAGLLFFRDPERSTPTDAGLLVAAADGKIDEITHLDAYDGISGPATRVATFLSVLDVHINRSPCSGVVRDVRYKPGKFLDARDPDCGRLNEANTIVIDPDAPHAGPIVVRQIAGLIARRIVCNVKPGDRVEVGQRIGLIKFGSRTEIIVPGHDTYEIAVKVNDRATGAMTILARRAKATTTDAEQEASVQHA